MLCTKCGKNPANVYIKNVVNGVVSEQHLCSECAAEQNLFPQISDPFAGLFAEPVFDDGGRCPLCGATASEIANTGRPGCPQCYTKFSSILTPMIKRIHGSLKHTGALPASASKELQAKKKLESLQGDLKTAVAAEEYEKAAKLRDEIRKLEKGMNDNA